MTCLGEPSISEGAPKTSVGVLITSLGGLKTSQESPATILGASGITLEQSWKYTIIGNPASASGYHSYYILFDFFDNSCVQFVFYSMYVYSYSSIHCRSGLATVNT